MSIPPGAPQPSYILRGHATPIHVAKFIRGNTRLVTGDAEGWVVMWSLESRRGTAVWRAHEGVLLGVGEWGEGVITHGKDNKLIIWKLPPSEEEFMSKVLPVDTVPEERRKPWILHMLDVNTMNFCAFAMCPLHPDIKVEEDGDSGKDEKVEVDVEKGEKSGDQLLLAVPNTLTSESIDIFHVPTLHRLHNIPSPGPEKPGMIMCLSLFFHPITKCLTVLSGYEDGSVSVFSFTSSISASSSFPSSAPSSRAPQWNIVYHSKSHIQPILSLSLDPSPDRKFFLTSGADDRIIKYLIPATTTPFSPSTSNSKSIISSAKDEPKMLKTAHAGQQSIEMRNDGKIAVTAGWDGRARVYGVAKMRELAVLKWHKDGCFAIAVADVLQGEGVGSGGDEKGNELVGRLGQLDVKRERLRKARETHWVAVGGKDGKVSLWDVY
ncbi:putative wd repeat protein [Botrytis cinerea BcDW1]|uniref:ASTRA-associated protein 1 n=1 Tax=Botryotinia fuckeliana (strain BcDW1) TaxID=1290391 RepID=M7TW56_BOTF1|nr:putative wd repeat protein [Botrytis cinerea BcDW1]